MLGLRFVSTIMWWRVNALCNCFRALKNKQNPLCVACVLLGLRCVGLAFCVENCVIEGKRPMQLF